MTKPFFPHGPTGQPAATPDTAQEILQRLRKAAERSRVEKDSGAAPAALGMRHGKGSRSGADQPALEEVLFAQTAAPKKRAFPVLAAIFMVSAIAGGGLAGVYLSVRNGARAPMIFNQDADARLRMAQARQTPGSTVVTKAPVQTPSRDAGRIIQPEPAKAQAPLAQASTAGELPPPPPLKTPVVAANPPVAQERSGQVPTAKTRKIAKAAPPEPVAPPAASVAAPGTEATPAASVAAPAPKAVAAPVPATAPEQPAAPAAVAAAPAQPEPMAGMAGDPETLKALTDNVVQALGGLNQPAGEARTGNLRQALASLVGKALSEGRSQDEIAGLLTRALKERNQALPEALKGPDGKVDINLLVASVIPKDAANYATGKDKGTMAMLIAESENASLTGDPRTSKERFYMRDGQRFTRIMAGDTLSHIAFAAYGDVLSYPLLLRANAGRISVRNLKPGTEIRIPEPGEAAPAQPPAVARQALGKPAAAPAKARKPRRKAARRSRANKGKAKITDRLLGAIAAPATANRTPAQPPVRPVTNFSPAARP